MMDKIVFLENLLLTYWNDYRYFIFEIDCQIVFWQRDLIDFGLRRDKVVVNADGLRVVLGQVHADFSRRVARQHVDEDDAAAKPIHVGQSRVRERQYLLGRGLEAALELEVGPRRVADSRHFEALNDGVLHGRMLRQHGLHGLEKGRKARLPPAV